MNEQDARAAVLAEARTWIRTPFHDGAQLKGVGVDCANLIAAVAHAAGVIPAPVEIAPYSPQFMLHKDQPLFESYVRRFAHETTTPGPADIVLYKIGRSFAHGAFVVEWPRAVIHAFKDYGFVAETEPFEGYLRGRDVKFFTLW